MKQAKRKKKSKSKDKNNRFDWRKERIFRKGRQSYNKITNWIIIKGLRTTKRTREKTTSKKHLESKKEKQIKLIGRKIYENKKKQTQNHETKNTNLNFIYKNKWKRKKVVYIGWEVKREKCIKGEKAKSRE